MTVHILGGGPAGLAIAHGVSLWTSHRFQLIERNKTLGGLAQSLEWGNFGTHDLGPHKFFSKDRELRERVESLLPNDAWLTRPKRSRIFLHGKFLPYPPSPFSLVGVFGPAVFARMMTDFAFAQVRALVNGAPAKTFEADLEHRLGRTLYEALFKPIAMKLWGDPANLDAKLSRGRVQTPTVTEVLARLAQVRTSSDFEALEFRYPRGGLCRLWSAVVDATKQRGEFHVGREVSRIDAVGDRVTALHVRDRGSHKTQVVPVASGEFVFSTLPLGILAQTMDEALPKRVVGLIRDTVWLNDLHLVFFKIDRPRLFEDSWVFVPDPNIAFHRVSEQESFDPGMTPNGSIVCCEIMNNETRAMSNKSDDELIRFALDGLDAMGFSGFRVVASRVIRLPASYPVFRPGFESGLDEILAAFDRFQNFRTVGRQGAFNYIGTLDAMDIGYGAARWLAARADGVPDSRWPEERQRTRHYPVLD